jgi:hypothetical protein
MRVFISWSGEPSRQLAEAVREWLPSALQYVKPYFTPADIEKGARWATEISNELSTSQIGIFILTRNNLNSKWMLFEAGAISKKIDKARICPIVFDIEPTDIEGPLAQFQATKFTRDDFRQLFNTINAAAGDSKLPDAIAGTVFEKWWPDLDAEVRTILAASTSSEQSSVRTPQDLLEETVSLVRTIAVGQRDLESKMQLLVIAKRFQTSEPVGLWKLAQRPLAPDLSSPPTNPIEATAPGDKNE